MVECCLGSGKNETTEHARGHRVRVNIHPDLRGTQHLPFSWACADKELSLLAREAEKVELGL